MVLGLALHHILGRLYKLVVVCRDAHHVASYTGTDRVNITVDFGVIGRLVRSKIAIKQSSNDGEHDTNNQEQDDSSEFLAPLTVSSRAESDRTGRSRFASLANRAPCITHFNMLSKRLKTA